uniref:Uncharacterized protein n=1 Tax=Anopheles atroparvus TaxID=41427 RepID=A0A182IRY3_ANOAO
MLHGPASRSARKPSMTHMLRSRFGVRRIERVIMSATFSTESFDGSGLSSSSSVMTLGPIGLSRGTTRMSDLTSWIQPVGLSVMSCSSTIEFGVSGSLSSTVSDREACRSDREQLRTWVPPLAPPEPPPPPPLPASRPVSLLLPTYESRLLSSMKPSSTLSLHRHTPIVEAPCRKRGNLQWVTRGDGTSGGVGLERAPKVKAMR